jgi:hypothetical protein
MNEDEELMNIFQNYTSHKRFSTFDRFLRRMKGLVEEKVKK